MSGALKSIGKIFKPVFRVIKKVALPALAIGAAVLTGGAALGVLGPAGLSSLGLSSAMTGILSTAGQSALIGGAVSAISGKNVLKGATTGFLVGGALGGVGAVTGGIGSGAQAAKAAATNGAAASGASAAGGALSQFVPGAAEVAANTAAGAGAAAGAASAAGGAAAGIGGGLLRGVGGVAKGIFSNPITAGMAIQGIGTGILGAQQAAEARRQDEQTRANYGGYAGAGGNFATIVPGTTPGLVAIDPTTGRIVNAGG